MTARRRRRVRHRRGRRRSSRSRPCSRGSPGSPGPWCSPRRVRRRRCRRRLPDRQHLPNVVFEIAAGGALAAVAVPLIARPARRGAPRPDADHTASALLTWALAGPGPAGGVLALAGRRLSDLVVLGDTACPRAARARARRMLRIFAPQVAALRRRASCSPACSRPTAGSWRRRWRRCCRARRHRRLRRLRRSSTARPRRLDSSATGPSGARPAAPRSASSCCSLPLLVPALRTGCAAAARPCASRAASAARAGHWPAPGVIALLAQQAAVVATLWLTHNRAPSAPVSTSTPTSRRSTCCPYAVLAVPIATAAFPALAHATAAESRQQVGTAPGPLGARAAGGPRADRRRGRRAHRGGPRRRRLLRALDRGAEAGGRRRARGAARGACRPTRPASSGFGVAALLTRALYVRGPAAPRGARRGRWAGPGGPAAAGPDPGGLRRRARRCGVLGIALDARDDASRPSPSPCWCARAWGAEASGRRPHRSARPWSRWPSASPSATPSRAA